MKGKREEGKGKREKGREVHVIMTMKPKHIFLQEI